MVKNIGAEIISANKIVKNIFRVKAEL